MSAFAQLVKNSLLSFSGLLVLLAVLILANVLLKAFKYGFGAIGKGIDPALRGIQPHT